MASTNDLDQSPQVTPLAVSSPDGFIANRNNTVLLGGGRLLFSALTKEQRWPLEEVVAYKNGFVGLVYRRAKPT